MLTNAQKIVKMENMQALFVQNFASNTIADITDNLFSEKCHFRANHEGIDARGIEEITAALIEMQNRRADKREVMCLNTPGFDFQNGNRALWDAYVYRFLNENEVQYVIEHFDVEYIEENDELKISVFSWVILTAMIPWNCDSISYRKQMQLNADRFDIMWKDADPDDFVKIQKLQAKFSQFNRKNADTLFSNHQSYWQMPCLFNGVRKGKEDIRKQLEELEKKEKLFGKFLAVPLITAPLIYTNQNETSGIGQWMVVCFSIMEQDEKGYPVQIHLGRFNQAFIKEEGEWRIKDFSYEQIADFIPYHYNHNENSHYDRMSRPAKKWLYGPENMGGTYAEDVFKIESIFPQWTYRLRSGDQVTIMDEYLKSEDRDIYRSLRGFSYTRNYGEEDMREYFIKRQDKSFETSMPAFHTATTPIVEVNADGTYAKACWLDHSISDLYKGKLNNERYKPYAAYVGKYENEFVKENGRWQLIGIGWEPLIALPDFYTDTECFEGWMNWKKKDLKYPKPFEKYE